MRSIYRPWQKLAERIERTALTDEEKLRLKHFFVFILIGLPAMLLFGLHNLLSGYVVLGWLCFLTAGLLLVSGELLLRNKRGLILYRCGAACFSLLLIYSLATGGEDGSKAMWVFTFPLIAFFLLGKKEGMTWSILFGSVLSAMMLLSPFAIYGYPYSPAFAIRLVLVYLMVSTIAFWFEFFRESYQRQLQQKRHLFLEVLQHSRDILYRRDLRTGEYEYISAAFGNLLGYSSAEVRAFDYRGIGELIHPEDRELHQAVVDSALQQQDGISSSADVEYRMRHRDGHYLWFNDRIQVIFDQSIKPEFMLGINREVTVERETRLAVEQMRDRLYTILNSIDAHVYVADMDSYQVLFMNDKMKRDFDQNLEGEKCWRCFRRLEAPCPHCTNSRLLDDKGNSVGVIEWESFNPVTGRWYNNYDRAINWLDQRWVRIQIAVDITHRKTMEEQRKQDEQALRKVRHLEAIGSLAGGLAHDFNNLFQVILGYCELVGSRNGTDTATTKYLAGIQSSLGKAIELANYLISLSSGGRLERKHVDLLELLPLLARETCNGQKTRAEINAPESLPTIMGDRQQLAIALKNVLTNSAESMAHDGLLQLSVKVVQGQELREDWQTKIPGNDELAQHYVVLQIVDHGCGIAAENLEKVFDPYFSTKEYGSEKGKGLGLSVSQSIIARHCGYLDIQSQEGEGTTVSIALPAS